MENSKSKFVFWPYGIAMLYAAFVLFFVFFIYFANSQKSELVDKNYYEKGINYQQQIDKITRTEALKSKFAVSYDKANQSVQIVFPESFLNKEVKGEVWFLRPSDSTLDMRMKFSSMTEGRAVLDTRLIEGFWRIKVDVSVNGIDYYNEKPLLVN